MDAYRIDTVVTEDRIVALHGVPFRAGDEIEVTIVKHPRRRTAQSRYPLRGTPFRYDSPFESVDEQEWEALG